LLGIGASAYFYLLSVERRSPVIAVESNRTEIIDGESISEMPIKVTRRNGEQITSNLYSARVYFWNDGRQSIGSENVLKPLRIAVGGGNEGIIYHRIVSRSRSITELSTKLDSSQGLQISELGAPNHLLLDFRILEENDGGVIQILYTGSKSAEIRLEGVVENSERLGRIQKSVPLAAWGTAIGKILLILSGGIILLLLFGVTVVAGGGKVMTGAKQVAVHLGISDTKLRKLAFWAMLLTSLILLSVGVFRSAENAIIQNAVSHVPKTILVNDTAE
jgi:hypothetical protein